MPTPKKSIYMDHASTTAVDPRVVEAMLPYFSERYGNASSLHAVGREARQAMSDARRTVADILGAAPAEIIFTSCGSEMEDEFGFRVTYLPVDEQGCVSADDVGRAITDETILISIMYANNEVGSIQPAAEIGKIAHDKGIPFHTDAVQAGGVLDLDVNRLNVDLLSLSAHKLYGPKGVGVLYHRRSTPLLPVQTGGEQERGRRAGTENVPYIVALATALRLAQDHCEQSNARVASLRDRLVRGIQAQVPDTRLTGHPTHRLPNSASFVFKGIEGEAILLGLDLQGVAASTGSACSSASQEASHVLRAMGLPAQLCRGSLRLTLGNDNTEEDVDHVLSILPGIVSRLRAMSPLYGQDV